MFRPIMAAVAVASLAGCSMPSMEASAEREAQAQTLLEDLAAARDDVVFSQMTTGADEAGFRAQMPFVKSMIPAGPVPKGVTVGWRANVGTGGATYAVQRTYDYPDRTLTVDSTFLKEGEVWKISSFHVAPTMKPASDATKDDKVLVVTAPDAAPPST